MHPASLRLDPEMRTPDYQGGSILNLITSLIRARGGVSDWADARALPAAELTERKHLVLLILDGLGADWLQRQAPDGWLARHQIATLTSVFPSTTAAAIGTYLTGEPPARHGIVGWFTWLRELGCVMKVLPGEPRAGGQGNWGMVKELRTLFPCPPVFDRLATAATVIVPEHLAGSAFNRAHLGRARLRPYGRLGECCRQIEQAVRRTRAPSLIYAYWSQLDHIGHEQGMDSPAALAHLQALEAALETLSERLQGLDVTLLISADHGQIDTRAADQVELHPDSALARRLRLPLCGEPRAAFCYTAGGDLETFLATARDALGARFLLQPAPQLLAEGLFGPGTPHAELTHRIGDVILLGRARWMIRDHLANESPFRTVGVHGGLSRAEMQVPLCRFDGDR